MSLQPQALKAEVRLVEEHCIPARLIDQSSLHTKSYTLVYHSVPWYDWPKSLVQIWWQKMEAAKSGEISDSEKPTRG